MYGTKFITLFNHSILTFKKNEIEVIELNCERLNVFCFLSAPLVFLFNHHVFRSSNMKKLVVLEGI